MRNILKKEEGRKKAKMALLAWYKNVGRRHSVELSAVRDAIKGKVEYVLDY